MCSDRRRRRRDHKQQGFSARRDSHAGPPWAGQAACSEPVAAIGPGGGQAGRGAVGPGLPSAAGSDRPQLTQSRGSRRGPDSLGLPSIRKPCGCGDALAPSQGVTHVPRGRGLHAMRAALMGADTGRKFSARELVPRHDRMERVQRKVFGCRSSAGS
jgi:hypothetical protein